MPKRTAIRLVQCAVFVAAGVGLSAYEFGPGPGYAGAPGDSNCAQCHGGGAVNTGGGGITLNLTSYKPGAGQHVVVTITDATARRWGFEATARTADNSQAGSCTPTDANTQVESAAGRQYIEHTVAGTRLGTSGPVSFEFDWTAPSGGGDITFYVAANAANGNNQADPGDHIYTASFKLSAASGGGNAAPTISASNGVVNGASFLPGIAPGAWVTIFGTNLAASTRTWRDDEIVGGKLPTSLDGVSVTINNKPAAVYYISPTQLNVQAPDDSATGSVQVTVTTAGGSVSAPANLSPLAPGMFLLDQGGRKYLAAQHSDFSVVAPAGLISGAATSPAKPGETVILYGTGFGATNPATPAGQVVTVPAPIDRSQLTVLIGGQPATVDFAGVTIAGVWQFNVTVPAGLPAGDAAVSVTMGGVRSEDNVFLPVGSQ